MLVSTCEQASEIMKEWKIMLRWMAGDFSPDIPRLYPKAGAVISAVGTVGLGQLFFRNFQGLPHNNRSNAAHICNLPSKG